MGDAANSGGVGYLAFFVDTECDLCTRLFTAIGNLVVIYRIEVDRFPVNGESEGAAAFRALIFPASEQFWSRCTLKSQGRDYKRYRSMHDAGSILGLPIGISKYEGCETVIPKRPVNYVLYLALASSLRLQRLVRQLTTSFLPPTAAIVFGTLARDHGAAAKTATVDPLMFE